MPDSWGDVISGVKSSWDVFFMIENWGSKSLLLKVSIILWAYHIFSHDDVSYIFIIFIKGHLRLNKELNFYHQFSPEEKRNWRYVPSVYVKL